MLCKIYKIKNKFTLVFYKTKNKIEINKENKNRLYVIYFYYDTKLFKIGCVL